MREKQIKIDSLNVNYKEIGNGEIPIVLLHGWGIDSDKYVELANLIINSTEIQRNKSDNSETSQESSAGLSPQWSQRNFKIIIPDLPGFGKSDEPDENWDLDDYVEFTDKFIKSVTQARGFELIKNILSKSNLKNIMNGGFSSISNTKTKKNKQVILTGHSFGGQIAIKYAIKYPEKIDRLILTGAAGIRHKLTAKQKMLFILAKSGKLIFSLPVINIFKIPIYKLFWKIARQRKKDYYCASPRMKEIMKNVLVEDLTLILKKIKVPTLLVWGKLDNSTPLSDGNLMNEKIENSELVIFDDANHSLPYQKPEEFIETIKEFIKKTEN